MLLLTEWPQYLDLDPVELGHHVRNRVLIDARNGLDPPSWRATGWTYRGLGVKAGTPF